jgi:NTP pyrophosphatase (non-canonical NTP hydrolase)
MVIINNVKIESLAAIYDMALGLERWFSNNNSAFAYGTRLCEEVGELQEVLVSVKDGKMNADTRKHLVKEVEDVLQIIIGILGIYNLIDHFPKDLTKFINTKNARTVTKDDIIAISVHAGQFADAINHMESQGIKKQKRGNNPDERLLEKANAFVGSISLFLQHYDLLDDLENQIKNDYLSLVERGFITPSASV